MKGANIAKFVFKTVLIASVLAIVAKIMLTSYFGYKHVNAEYGGIYFYHWRVKYMDKKLLKSFYARNKLNEHAYSKILTRYSDMVQGTTKRHIISYNPRTKENKYGKERTEYPYYAYGFPDTFVLNPSKTWEIFKDDPRALDIELSFLKMRGEFISKIYDVKFNINNKYFKDQEKSGKKSESKGSKLEGKPLKKKTYFTKVDRTKIEKFFNDPENQKVINVPQVVMLVSNIRSRGKEYNIEIINNEAKMSKKLEKELMPILENIFKGYEMTTIKVNSFFTRLAKIDVSPMDVHILHRFYMLMVYVYAYADVKGANENYDIDKKEFDFLSAKSEMTKENKRKLKSLSKNLEEMRYEIILTKISQIVGLAIGRRGIFLDKEGDKRGFLESYGSPHGLKSSKFKDGKKSYIANESLLDKEFNKIKMKN